MSGILLFSVLCIVAKESNSFVLLMTDSQF